MERIKVVSIALGIIIALGFFWQFFPGSIKKRDTPASTGAFSLSASAPDSSIPIYEHDMPAFSFRYPESLRITAFPEGEEGEVVLAQGTNPKSGFQIFIRPFDEAGSITPARILRDLPDEVIREPQDAVIGGRAQALAYRGERQSFGGTREVWFADGGYLYQVTSSDEFDEELSKIMSTWKFSTNMINNEKTPE